MKTQDQTPASSDTEEKDYVLKIEVGLIFPLRASSPEDAVEKGGKLIDQLAEYLKLFDVAPEVVHVLNGEAMEREGFEQLRERAKAQVDALRHVLSALKAAGAEDMQILDMTTGAPVPMPTEISAADLKGADQPGDAVVDAVEPSPDAFLAPGSRTVN